MADVEGSVVAHLAGVLAGVPVSTRSRPSGTHVLVRRDGGSADHHRILDTARMNVRVWADTRDTAQAVADQVRGGLARHTVSAGLVWVDVDEQSVVRLHDDDREQHGWMVVVDIVVRAPAGLVV